MPRILSISRNPRLLALRNDALALAGYKVASPREPNEAVLLLSQERFDAVVVGHSVEPEIRRILIRAVRNLRPNIPIVFVFRAPESAEEPLADLSIDLTDGPMPLVSALDDRLRRAQAGS
jgi:DNA-binding response OmpR family regulator